MLSWSLPGIFLNAETRDAKTIMSNSPEYNSISDCILELRLSVKANLLFLSGELLAARLISKDKEESLRNRSVPEAERAADLVSLVLDKVREDPKNYHEFVKILKKDEQQHKTVIDMLEEKYISYKGAAGETPKAFGHGGTHVMTTASYVYTV